MLMKCKKCKKKFKTFPSRIKDGHGKFCSKKCMENKVSYRCNGCPKILRTSKSELKSKSGKAYCTRECFYKNRNITKKCTGCGKEFKVWKCRKWRKACSKSCGWVQNRLHEVVSYNGINYYKATGGYYVSRPNGKHGMMLHRQVYEDNTKTKLTKIQTIHHINGIKTDNRFINLELWQNRHPKGVRMADLNKVLV